MDVTANAAVQKYINDVCAQIKFREVHQEIKLELKNHLQELIEAGLAKGFSHDEAIKMAVAQMGRADLIGKQLNKVHQSKPEWSVLLLSILFACTGLLSMYFIDRQGLFVFGSIPLYVRSLFFGIAGVAIALGLYLFDYRKLEVYSKYIYMGTVLALTFAVFFGQRFNGKAYLGVGPVHLDIVAISPLLFCIALAGILNKWDWNRSRGTLIGLLLCFVPLCLILAVPSLSAAAIYCASCIVLMAVSGVRLKNILLLIGLALGTVILQIVSDPYRLQCLLIFINPESDPSGSGWLNIELSKLIDSSGFWGQGFILKPGSIPELHTDFVFSYIIFTFGWIAGTVLSILIVLFILRMIWIATVVNNSYAKLILSGLIAIFSVQFLWNILMNLGLAPVSGVGLPFISYGGSQLIFNAASIGVVLSVYRRRNISFLFRKKA